MRRHLLNFLTIVSLLSSVAIIILWSRSTGVARLFGYELFTFRGEWYIWSGERTLVARSNYVPLLLISLAIPVLRFASMIDRWMRQTPQPE